MPLDIAVRRKGSEMRARLRPVVEPEHGGNHPAQFVGQMDPADPAAIGPAGVLELLDTCRAGSANGSATARSGSRTELELFCNVGLFRPGSPNGLMN